MIVRFAALADVEVPREPDHRVVQRRAVVPLRSRRGRVVSAFLTVVHQEPQVVRVPCFDLVDHVLVPQARDDVLPARLNSASLP